MPTGKIIDSAPEQNKPLSAKYKKSFAYPTFKTRAPKILDGVIALLKTEDNKPQEAVDESKVLIRQIEEMKSQMQNDKPLTVIQPPEGVLIDEDLSVYNNMLSERKQRGQFPTWFETEWLFAECYMYRRLNQIFENSNSFQKFDPFMPEKVKTLIASKEPIIVTAKILRELKETLNLTEEKRKEMFIFFLKCSLWGNKADLSLSGGSAVAAECMTADDESTILVNDTLAAYEALKSSSENVVVDIILDNAGYELYNDLCFADYLIWSGLAHTVNFHGKLIPWFVSDVTHQDFDMIFTLLKSNFEYEYLSQLVDQWQKYINAGSWTMKCDKFWVLPYDYSQMKNKDVELHDKLADSQLLVFKGDLNYRKLVGDIAWEPTTPFEKALRGFRPTNLVALRTVKADTICGLKPGQAESITKIHPNWMITGDYAVIQFLKKN